VTLPVILLSYGVASGLLFSPVLSAAVSGFIAWIVAAMLLAGGARSIKRERLLGVAAEA
jgi:ABC-type uncharacterized transport system permease subunit